MFGDHILIVDSAGKPVAKVVGQVKRIAAGYTVKQVQKAFKQPKAFGARPPGIMKKVGVEGLEGSLF